MNYMEIFSPFPPRYNGYLFSEGQVRLQSQPDPGIYTSFFLLPLILSLIFQFMQLGFQFDSGNSGYQIQNP